MCFAHSVSVKACCYSVRSVRSEMFRQNLLSMSSWRDQTLSEPGADPISHLPSRGWAVYVSPMDDEKGYKDVSAAG